MGEYEKGLTAIKAPQTCKEWADNIRTLTQTEREKMYDALATLKTWGAFKDAWEWTRLFDLQLLIENENNELLRKANKMRGKKRSFGYSDRFHKVWRSYQGEGDFRGRAYPKAIPDWVRVTIENHNKLVEELWVFIRDERS